jgi:HSP20 family protein
MYESMLNFPGTLFGEMERLQRNLDAAFSGSGLPNSIRSVAAGSFPAINVGKTGSSVEVYAFAPGLDASKIDLSIERGVLRLAGERAPVKADPKATVYSRERPFGHFERAVNLPDDVDTSRVNASYRDGVLRVSVPRSEAAQPKRIAIQ